MQKILKLIISSKHFSTHFDKMLYFNKKTLTSHCCDRVCLLFAGELDHLPEVAFYMVGAIEEVVARAEKLAESQS